VKKPYSPLPEVLYEDEWVVAFDKPAGLLVAPDRWDTSAVYLMALVHKYRGPEYANVHRLDRDTSGVIVVAKSLAALHELQKRFDAGQVEKTYLALTAGAPSPAAGEIDAAISPDRHRPGRMRLSTDGKPSRTRYETVERFNLGYTLVHAYPETGRTHQVRLHLKSIGCPIVGDPFYGAGGLFLSEIKSGYRPGSEPERPLIGRTALHALRIALPHPATQQPLVIEAPLPKDFEVALKYLRRFAGG
jgi:RluA family pseudouridine synthase